jgi:hypothetical protein
VVATVEVGEGVGVDMRSVRISPELLSCRAVVAGEGVRVEGGVQRCAAAAGTLGGSYRVRVDRESIITVLYKLCDTCNIH